MGKEHESGFISYDEVSEIQKNANREIYLYCKTKLDESLRKIITIQRFISLVTDDDPVRSDLVSLLQGYIKERDSMEKELKFLEEKSNEELLS